jgi:hypothetical protein
MTGTASLSVRHAENRIWGLHVFLEATGDPEAIRDAYAREAPEWPRFWPALGFRVAKLRLTRELPQ